MTSAEEIVLQDGDVRLRTLNVPEGVPLAVAWYRDPVVLHYSEGEGTPPYDAAMVERMFRDISSRCELYLIEVLTPEGWLAIGDAALCGEAGTPIVIGEPAFRSRGIGTVVLRLLLNRARALGWPRLVAKGVYEDNIRARRLYERAGFRVSGEAIEEAGRRMWRLELTMPPLNADRQ